MESLNTKYRNTIETIVRQFGMRSINNPNLHQSSQEMAGAASFLFRLPSTQMIPIRNPVSGAFYYMADYDPIDDTSIEIQ